MTSFKETHWRPCCIKQQWYTDITVLLLLVISGCCTAQRGAHSIKDKDEKRMRCCRMTAAVKQKLIFFSCGWLTQGFTAVCDKNKKKQLLKQVCCISFCAELLCMFGCISRLKVRTNSLQNSETMWKRNSCQMKWHLFWFHIFTAYENC